MILGQGDNHFSGTRSAIESEAFRKNDDVKIFSRILFLKIKSFEVAFITVYVEILFFFSYFHYLIAFRAVMLNRLIVVASVAMPIIVFQFSP